MLTEDLEELHREVWKFRGEMQTTWPTPWTLDALRFAFTEAGEALDAWLRVHGGYARNHEKQPDIMGELADCALMLITALGPDCDFETLDWPVVMLADCNLEMIGYWTGAAVSVFRKYPKNPAWMRGTLAALDAIWNYPHMDLETELRKRLARIRAKHGAQP